ncbi:GNAT family N-acetyltransferase [Thermomonospora cellulosilytica]|uniref:GNAT superfamily N-acetyltransferase n=1 Tax=Thermomonospora cellulosilytica TaxID=1411118 RepID=A0A7W3R7C0_9ACTN|nr:GNAT family N-acetyltransferase [Thermomonospora cellulosilytica]MBA9003073.1 GNAT superfamily N-acetyltransferase [Thermomonospora cellulosilytica]
MAGTARDVVLTHYTSQAARSLLDALCVVYADAYGVDPSERKTDAFRERAGKGMEREGFELVTAEADGDLVGFAFGYPLPAGNTYWWEGLRPEPPEGFTVETGTRTFVLAEIEVRRAWQGRGVGRRLHDELLSGRSEERATLATNPKAADTHAVYEAWGWQMVGQVPGTSGDYFDAYDLFVLPLASERPR